MSGTVPHLGRQRGLSLVFVFGEGTVPHSGSGNGDGPLFAFSSPYECLSEALGCSCNARRSGSAVAATIASVRTMSTVV